MATEIVSMQEIREGRPIQEMKGVDPIIRFEQSVGAVAMNLDLRPEEQLIDDGLNHPDPVIREHSLYQLVTQQRPGALRTVEQALFSDTDEQLRVNLMWLLEEMEQDTAKKLMLALREDKNHRVREWARVFAWEKGWAEDFRKAREAKHWPGRTFDETVFLHIRCHIYVRLSDSNDLWGHVLMSPQMLARIYGQALACPVVETRERQLVLSKTLKGLHADGTDHYEAFNFKGFTERSNALQGNFYFEAHTPRPFYLSGKADDPSEGVVENVTVPFAREGQWFLNDKMPIKGKPAIEYVRGRFQGWAYVNLDRIQREDGNFLFAGNSVLSTLHHPIVGPKTNTFLAGSFKGKVLDWDGDGVLDFNYLPSYATREGEIDSNLDNIPDVPGRHVCARGTSQG